MSERSGAERPELDPFRPRPRKYIYRDNNAGGRVVFECVADGILEADKLYQEKTGRDVVKQSYVGCSVEELEGSPPPAEPEIKL